MKKLIQTITLFVFSLFFISDISANTGSTGVTRAVPISAEITPISGEIEQSNNLIFIIAGIIVVLIVVTTIFIKNKNKRS